MYNFTDTNQQGQLANRPAESLTFNGINLDDNVEGFTTLYVRGRESLSINIDTMDDEYSDGLTFKRRRFGERTLTVGYRMEAESPDDFREQYNKLLGILSATEVQIIVDDEPDKYFTGTVSDIEVPEGGLLCVTAEFEIMCSDPFKYSIEEKSATGTTSIPINYRGTYPASPTIVTTMSRSNNGYISYMLNSSILEFGSKTEENHEAETLLEYTPTADDVTGGATASNISSIRGNGTWQCKDGGAEYSPYGGQLRGSSLTWGLSKTSVNCVAKISLFIPKQDPSTGVRVYFLDASGGIVAEAGFWSTGELTVHAGSTGRTARFQEFYPYGTDGPVNVSVSMSNNIFNVNCVLGSLWCDGGSHSPIASIAIESQNVGSTEPANGYPRIYGVVFTKEDDSGARNTFSKYDAFMNTRRTSYINGIPRYDVGNIYNDFDDFQLKPGDNALTVGKSEWAQDMDTSITYREVYL